MIEKKSAMDDLTDFERGVIDVIRMNRAERRTEIKRRYSIGRLQIDFSWRSRKNLWGRFGGGFNWRVGFEAGSWRSFAFLLFVCRVGFWLRRRENDDAKS